MSAQLPEVLRIRHGAGVTWLALLNAALNGSTKPGINTRVQATATAPEELQLMHCPIKLLGREMSKKTECSFIP